MAAILVGVLIAVLASAVIGTFTLLRKRAVHALQKRRPVDVEVEQIVREPWRLAFPAQTPIEAPLWRPFMKTPQQGAATSSYLASSPQAEGITGTYFAKGRPQTSNKASYDDDAATRLWQVSAGLVGLATAA